MFSLEKITEIVQGQLFPKKVSCSCTNTSTDSSSTITDKAYPLNVCIDSRKADNNSIFIAIIGENNDGHKYVSDVISKNVELIIVSDESVITGESNFILVEDTVLALGKIAKAHLQTLNVKTIGITGSSGKTTTKDILAQLLSKAYGKECVVYPEKSFNNEIGMPLTVLKANSDTKILLLEMGASGLGHLQYLTEIAPLDYAIVLFVGTAHLGGFGSFESIVKAKTELVQGLKPNGVAILNLDDSSVANMQTEVKGRSIFYSAQGEFCDIWAENIVLDDDQHPSFELCSPATRSTVNLPLIGKHNVVNALAACALMSDLGHELADIAENISEITLLSEHRLSVQRISSGALVIDDAYNANPDSMKAGITCLVNIANAYKKQGEYRAIAVLGQMLELGDESDEIHADIARYINNLQVDVVITVGEFAKSLADNILISKVHQCSDILDVEKLLGEYLQPNDIVLFKGSNGSRVWELADKAVKGEI